MKEDGKCSHGVSYIYFCLRCQEEIHETLCDHGVFGTENCLECEVERKRLADEKGRSK